MGVVATTAPEMDHCRIGSLEIFAANPKALEADHCRIGSLETKRP